MKSSVRFAVAAALSLAAFASTASAGTQLIAVGTLTGTADLSGLTGTLESGLAANVLGGIGSGLAYGGGNTFLALPDRGPNATAWTGGTTVDNTTSYISRFQTITMDLTANTSGSGLAYTLSPTLSGTTLLYSTTALNYGTAGAPSTAGLGDTSGKYYFTGRSDAFGAGSSLAANDGRLDPESIRVSNDGQSVFISDEYGPYVRQFNRATGELMRTFDLPSQYAATTKNSVGATEISGNTVGRVANKGMEGLAISPDGSTLYGFMQSPLAQDGGDGGRYNRIIKIDIATGATTQYVYDNYITTDPTGGATLNKAYNSSEIIAINDHEFLVLERDGKGLGDSSNAVVKKVYKIDLTGATALPQGVDGNSTVSGAANVAGYAVTKTQYLDLRAALKTEFGLTDAQIPAKLEALAFGQDVTVGGQLMHTLYVANDNDFLPGTCATATTTVCNTNNFYVFAFDANTGGLSNFTAQALASPVPVPGAAWLMLSGLGALGVMRRRRKTGAKV